MECVHRLNTNLPKETCTKGNFIVQLQIKGTSLNTNASNAVDLPSGDPPPRLTSRGELMIGNEYYSMKEYCLFGWDYFRHGREGVEKGKSHLNPWNVNSFRFNDTTVSARVCNATCSEAAPCIRKCCDLNEVFDLNHGGKLGCSESRERVWTPEFYATGKIKSSKEIYPHYKIVSPRNWCNRSYKPRVIDHYDPRTGSRLWYARIQSDISWKSCLELNTIAVIFVGGSDSVRMVSFFAAKADILGARVKSTPCTLALTEG